MNFIIALTCAAVFASAPVLDVAPEGVVRAQQTGAAEGQKDQPELAEAEQLTAEVKRLFGVQKFEEALAPARRVVELREKALGPDHPLVALALYNLATVHAEMKRPAEAETLYRRALTIFDRSPGSNVELAANTANRLALVSFNRKDYKEAEAFFQRALDILSKIPGREQVSLVPVLLNLFELHVHRGNVEKGEPFLVRAFDILEKREPKKDDAGVQRLKSYYCPLMLAKRSETARRLQKNIYRMENPEKAAELERKRKEREAKGEEADIEGGVLNGRAVSKAAPSYPPEARQNRLSGTVVIYITVDEEGKVIKSEPLCGHSVLAKAGEEAVRRWKFTPTLLSGVPIKVTGVVTVNFAIR
jgi:TonB family protein